MRGLLRGAGFCKLLLLVDELRVDLAAVSLPTMKRWGVASRQRRPDWASSHNVGVDEVTEEFPFLVTKLSPYYDR